MAMQDSNYVVISINEKLQSLRQPSSDECIFKVPNQLRLVNEKAYEPQVISVGPYHHGKDHLKAMKDNKVLYVKMFLQRSGMNVSELVEGIGELEERARKCYAEVASLTKDEFTEMLVLDGWFNVEFFCKSRGKIEWNDPVFKWGHLLVRSIMDLVLVENQLPFFFLMELFSMIKLNPAQVIDKILGIYSSCLPGDGHKTQHKDIAEMKHLLGLIHENWQPFPARLKIYSQVNENYERSFPRCATKLREAGIKLKKTNKDDDDDDDIQ